MAASLESRTPGPTGSAIGVNTNFNPVAFTATLFHQSGVGDTYYVSFYASNTSAQVWSPVAGTIIGGAPPPQLNPANYAYRAQISFPGYQGFKPWPISFCGR